MGQFFGSSPNISVIQASVNNLWGRWGRIDVIALGNDGFLFTFACNDTKTLVLDGGP